MANHALPYPDHEKSSQQYPGQVNSHKWRHKVFLILTELSQALQNIPPPQPFPGQSLVPVVVKQQYVSHFRIHPPNMRFPQQLVMTIPRLMKKVRSLSFIKVLRSEVTMPHLILVATATTGVSVLFSTESSKLWPIWALFAYLVVNFCTLWVHFTNLDNSVAYQKWQLSGMDNASPHSSVSKILFDFAHVP